MNTFLTIALAAMFLLLNGCSWFPQRPIDSNYPNLTRPDEGPKTNSQVAPMTPMMQTTQMGMIDQSKNMMPATPLNVIGVWDCTHPAWHNTITLAENGTFIFGTNKVAGFWSLTGAHGEVMLVLAWSRWPAETARMIGPDDFVGKVQNGELKMHRLNVQQ